MLPVAVKAWTENKMVEGVSRPFSQSPIAFLHGGVSDTKRHMESNLQYHSEQPQRAL